MATRGTVQHDFSDGRFIVDLDGLWRVFYDDARTANYLNARYQTLKPVDVSLFGPTLATLEIDIEGASTAGRLVADTENDSTLKKIAGGSFTADSLRQTLKSRLGKADASRAALSEQLARNARDNAKNLASNNDKWDSAIVTAERIRDASVIVLGVGATMLSGGAAVGVLATGSSLGAVAKVQDSKKQMTSEQAIGAAVGVAAIDFSFSLITLGMGPMIKNSGKIAKFAIAVTVNTSGNAASGLLMAEPGDDGAIPTSADQLGSSYVSAVVSEGLSSLIAARAGTSGNAAFRKLILPATSWLRKASDAKLDGVVIKTGEKLLEGAITKLGTKTIEMAVADGMDQSPLLPSICTAPVFGGSAAIDARLDAILSRQA